MIAAESKEYRQEVYRQRIPIFTEKMGIPGPYSTRKMGTRVPIITVEWGPGILILGGPHFTLTPGGVSGKGLADYALELSSIAILLAFA